MVSTLHFKIQSFAAQVIPQRIKSNLFVTPENIRLPPYLPAFAVPEQHLLLLLYTASRSRSSEYHLGNGR